MIDLLAPHSRGLWELCFTGNVARLREVLAEQPERAKMSFETTPPSQSSHDEAKAVEIIELFLSLGADASFRRKDGKTAADVARRRGLDRAAQELDQAAAIAPYESLAHDLVRAFDTGDADALARLIGITGDHRRSTICDRRSGGVFIRFGRPAEVRDRSKQAKRGCCWRATPDSLIGTSSFMGC